MTDGRDLREQGVKVREQQRGVMQGESLGTWKGRTAGGEEKELGRGVRKAHPLGAG